MPRLPRCKVTTLSDGVGSEYYLDERLKELRDVDNPHARLDFDDVLLGTLAGVLKVEAVRDEADPSNVSQEQLNAHRLWAMGAGEDGPC